MKTIRNIDWQIVREKRWSWLTLLHSGCSRAFPKVAAMMFCLATFGDEILWLLSSRNGVCFYYSPPTPWFRWLVTCFNKQNVEEWWHACSGSGWRCLVALSSLLEGGCHATRSYRLVCWSESHVDTPKGWDTAKKERWCGGAPNCLCGASGTVRLSINAAEWMTPMTIFT